MAHKNWFLAGGVEQHMFDVSDWLQRRGHVIVPFSVQNPSNVTDSPQFVSSVDMRSSSLRGRARAAERALFGTETRRKAREIVSSGVDVAYVGHVYHQMGFYFLKDLKRAGIPLVLSLHDYKLGCANYQLINERTGTDCRICIERRNGYLYGPLLTRCSDTSVSSSALLTLEGALSRWSRSYADTADAVTVVNSLQKASAVSFGIPEERITEVPHYVERARGPIRWHSDGRRKTALFVGRLSPEKGVDTLIKAAAATQTPVRIVGDGRLRSQLEALAKTLDAPVTFLGWKERADVETEMENADALVLPSTSEVWGLVANEAISLGLPVIASAVGGLPDLLGEGRGQLFEAGNESQLADILRRLQAGDERFRLAAENARDYCERELSRDRWEERLRSVFAMAGVEV